MQDTVSLQKTCNAQDHLGENSGNLPIVRIIASETLAKLEDECWAILQIGHFGIGRALPPSACHKDTHPEIAETQCEQLRYA